MSKMNVYVYWFSKDGSKKTKNNVIDKLKKVENINLVIGPTMEEHNGLLKEYSFYKKSIKMNKISWASNIWRFKKCLEKPGVYIDISGDIDIDKFSKFIDYVSSTDKSIYVKERPHVLATGFYYEKDKDILEKCLSTYKRMHWWRPVFTFKPDNVPATKIFSRVIHQKRNLFLGNWNEEIHDDFEMWNVETLFGKRTGYKKMAMASWVSKKNKLNDYFGDCLDELKTTEAEVIEPTLD